MKLNAKEDAVLDLIQKDTTYANYFFKRVVNLKWFYPLQEKRFFDASEAPYPEPADKEGLFVIPQWNVLPYLEKVSEQAMAPGNEHYHRELLVIIERVSTYRDAESQHIDNYRTWWFFVKILINIPPEKIPTKIIDLIPIWLDSKFDTSLPGADIVNKLLPRFLSDRSHRENVKKAEKIFKYVTKLKRVKTSHRRSLLDHDEKFVCVIDHYWLEEAFKKYASDIGEKCSKTVVIDVCNKIKKILRKKEARLSFSIDNRPFLLTLKETDKNLYDLKILDADEGDRNQTYRKAFEEIVKGRKVKHKIIGQYSISASTLQGFVQEAYAPLRKHTLLGTYNEEDFKHDLHDLYYGLYSRETYWSFYEERQYGKDNALGVLTLALQQILLAKANSDSKATSKILNLFFKENYIFFPKMALYIIANTAKDYVDCFWEALSSESQYIVFDSLATQDELGHVLDSIASDLTEEQIEKLRHMIESGPKYLRSENREHWIDMWKQERYGALSANPYFKGLHDALKQKTGFDVRLRPAISDGDTWAGPGPSALTKDDILQKTSAELADYLAIFKETGHWEKPTERGLAEILKQTAQDRPEKFLENTRAFLKTSYLYVDYMLWGICDAWKNKKDISWNNLFDFIKSYISQGDFWENKLPAGTGSAWTPDHESVCGMIGEIVQEGTRDDTHAIPEPYLDKVKEIVFLILDKLIQPPISKEEHRDFVTHALNSAFGKVIAAFMQLALRMYRVNKKNYDDKEVKWDKEFREKMNSLFSRGIIEAHTWFGYYLPQLTFLDRKWTQEKIVYFNEKRGDMVWEAFMNGYLFGSRVYNDIYPLMRLHYDHALTFSFKETHYRERLVQHITIGYMQSLETIDGTDSLFKRILDSRNFEQIREIINFFWMQRDYVTGKSREAKEGRRKIIEFWREIHQQYSEKDMVSINKDDKLLLSDLSKLTAILENIDDENLKWLMLLAPHVHEDFNASSFIEALDRLKDRGDKHTMAAPIGQVYLKMLETITPDYDQKHIRSIVEFLYDAGGKGLANDICNKYGENGYEFLRDIYEKNRGK